MVPSYDQKLQKQRLWTCEHKGRLKAFKRPCKALSKNLYAHIEVLVIFLLVKVFGFRVIARYHTIRF